MSDTVIRLLCDAHAHLLDSETLEHTAAIAAGSNLPNPNYSVINGTSPGDWADVLEFARNHAGALPAIGLHPVEVQTAPQNWKETFLHILDNNPVCAVGEVGLDRRDQSDNVENQLNAFCWQMEQACARNLPVSIHCVKATGLLMDTLRTCDLPAGGIHLHAYSGPVELIPELVKMGAFFSFAARQLGFASKKVHSLVRTVPIQRLLIETDKPYRNDFSILRNCYSVIAEIRKMSVNELSVRVGENFKNCFLNSTPPVWR